MPKTILITGATTGIGRHAALRLARSGHRVIATGRDTDALEALRVEGSLNVLQLDVTDRASLAQAVAGVAALTEGRGLDVLINNAGYGETAPMLEVSEADVRAMYETNVFGLLAVTRAFLPAMVARRSGRIVNVGSIAGRVTLPFFGAYSSTKFAVEAISDAMRLELRNLGIRVVLVEPAAVISEFSKTSVRKVKTEQPESPYASIHRRSHQIKAVIDSISSDPAVVSRIIEHAVTTEDPRARYVSPFWGHLMVATRALLPPHALDWAVSKVLGLG